MGEDRHDRGAQGRAAKSAFTVLSMSISLVAVFFPILLLGGIVGRIFHEFAVTLTTAIVMSLIVSLTVTPMMCAYLDFTRRRGPELADALVARAAFEASQDFYRRTLAWSLDNPKTIMFDPAGRGGAECLSAGHRAQGLFPRPGRTAACRAASAATRASPSSRCRRNSMQFVDIIKRRSGGGDGGRLRRRPGHQYRQCLRHPEAAAPSAASDHRSR